jgi:hypothetical protein
MKLILIRIPSDDEYIVKRGNYCALVDAFVIIDENNYAIGYSIWGEGNKVYLIDKYNIRPAPVIRAIGEKKFNAMEDGDKYTVLKINEWKSFCEPVLIKRKVARIRKPEEREIIKIEKHIIKEYIQEHKITFKDTLNKTPAYLHLYEWCKMVGLSEMLYDYVRWDRLYHETDELDK